MLKSDSDLAAATEVAARLEAALQLVVQRLETRAFDATYGHLELSVAEYGCDSHGHPTHVVTSLPGVVPGTAFEFEGHAFLLEQRTDWSSASGTAHPVAMLLDLEGLPEGLAYHQALRVQLTLEADVTRHQELLKLKQQFASQLAAWETMPSSDMFAELTADYPYVRVSDVRELYLQVRNI